MKNQRSGVDVAVLAEVASFPFFGGFIATALCANPHATQALQPDELVAGDEGSRRSKDERAD
jgi:hypothetical protein